VLLVLDENPFRNPEDSSWSIDRKKQWPMIEAEKDFVSVGGFHPISDFNRAEDAILLGGELQNSLIASKFICFHAS
jgi:hypothetical protein